MATATLPQTLHSTTLLNGALRRGKDCYHWNPDGAKALHVRPMRMEKLMPRPHILRRYGKTWLTLPTIGWRDVFEWSGDHTVGAYVDDLIRTRGRPTSITSGRFANGGPSNRVRPSVPGVLISFEDWEVLAAQEVPCWPVNAAEHVFSNAQMRATLFLDDEALNNEVRMVARLFFSSDALERFGSGPACVQAAAAFGVVTEHLREAWAAWTDREALWEYDAALSRCLLMMPPKWWTLSEAELLVIAARFAPMPNETRRQA